MKSPTYLKPVNILVYLFYSFNLVLGVNFFSLNARFANSHLIFLASLGVVLFAYLYRHFFPDWLRILGAVPLFLDYGLVYYQTNVWFNQILPAVIC